MSSNVPILVDQCKIPSGRTRAEHDKTKKFDKIKMVFTIDNKIGHMRNLPMSRASVLPRRKTSCLKEVYEHKGFSVKLKPENP